MPKLSWQRLRFGVRTNEVNGVMDEDIERLINVLEERAVYAHALAFEIETLDHKYTGTWAFETCGIEGCARARELVKRLRKGYGR